jgi:hypothetical protein
MDDDPLPDDERSERDRELHAAVLFRLKQILEKPTRERGDLKPPPSEPDLDEAIEALCGLQRKAQREAGLLSWFRRHFHNYGRVFRRSRSAC